MRKTVRLSQPNPLFEKWLGEWRDEAAARGSDLQYAFAKALKSLKKYPLPLNSGKECAILEHFGTRICLLLDRKLSEHRKNSVADINAPIGVEVDDDVIVVVSPPKGKKEKRKTPAEEKTQKPEKKKKSKEASRVYVPTLRSAAYAVLVALYRHHKEGAMTKEALQKASQPFCDTSMFKPVAGSRYCGWSAVGQLVNKGLVARAGKPHRYNLTAEGVALAEKLPVIDMDLSCFGSPAPPPAGSRPHTPPPTTSYASTKQISPVAKSCASKKLTSPDAKSYAPKKQALPSTSSYSSKFVSDKPLSEWGSSQESETASEDQEQLIFMPGTFTIVLIVDTQEINKGDELVKELEALGAPLEVRKLSAGDFAWVARDADSRELLLPFVIERKRLDDLASSIKDGRFHEQKFRLKQSGVARPMYLVESHGQRQYSLPLATLQQAAVNTQFVDGFCVKHTRDQHDTAAYLAAFTGRLANKFKVKTLIGCRKQDLPLDCDITADCLSLMTFKEFNKLSVKNRKYTVREMFIKQLVQLRGLSVTKSVAVADRWPGPRPLADYISGGGMLDTVVGPTLARTLERLYTAPLT